MALSQALHPSPSLMHILRLVSFPVLGRRKTLSDVVSLDILAGVTSQLSFFPYQSENSDSEPSGVSAVSSCDPSPKVPDPDSF